MVYFIYLEKTASYFIYLFRACYKHPIDFTKSLSIMKFMVSPNPKSYYLSFHRYDMISCFIMVPLKIPLSYTHSQYYPMDPLT